jgi:signal transduction histidine kinase
MLSFRESFDVGRWVPDDAAGSPFKLIPYLLRTVDVGVRATYLTLAVLGAFLLIPGRPSVNLTAYLAVLVVGTVGAVGVSLLPWKTLFESGRGMLFLYAWSAFDIVLISILIVITGGADSFLFVLFALTTVFFAASYPPVGQAGLLVFTWVCFAVAVVASDVPVNAATVATRMGLLLAIAFIAHFLSRELARSEELIRRYQETELRQRQALEINDSVVQGLVVAKYALESGEHAKGQEAVERTLGSARKLVTELLESSGEEVAPGDFVRAEPAFEEPPS